MQNINESDIVSNLHQFVTENYPRARQGELQAEDQLIDTGVIDSLGLLTLIDYLEGTFDIRVSDEDVTQENFGSIQAIASYVRGTLANGA